MLCLHQELSACHVDASAAALNEDPAPFEAELAAREKALGADHVDVAESLSNLAILYNQKGEMGKALPLYERALRIWEAQKGPEHPEVAHTLTDLAVLHLEQVGPSPLDSPPWPTPGACPDPVSRHCTFKLSSPAS